MATKVPFCFLFLLAAAGCSPSGYPYRIITNDCNCEELRIRDKSNPVEYTFRAHYRMEDGIFTVIDIGFTNRSSDTLFLDAGAVQVASLNVTYQSGGKFVPLPQAVVLPGHSDEVRLTGKETGGKEDWTKIAGERMTVTVRGLLLGTRILTPVSMIFVPVNPKLRPQ